MTPTSSSFAVLALAALFPFAPPTAIDRWLHNPRELTATGLAALDAGEPDRAARAVDRAVRLAPDDPRLLYTAGTVHLLGGSAKSVALLERARDAGGEATGADTHYNLGNAHLAHDNAAAAVEAYKASLRRRPNDVDAKVNLEIALSRLKRQRLAGKGDQPTPEADERGDEETSSAPGADEPATDSQAEGDESTDPGAGDATSGSGAGERPLPHFQDQPDMSAEQAAAILEAVENLEREERRAAAARRAARRTTGERDW